MSVHIGATFSPCRKYRYTLFRNWHSLSDKGVVMFVGLNPSTADETNDDPTIRRCIGYAKNWGYSGIVMTNIFAYRATDPKDMKAISEPVGEENDQALKDQAARAGIVIAAWGAHGAHLARGEYVRALLPELHYLRLTKDGHPGHPLYLPAKLKPAPWER